MKYIASLLLLVLSHQLVFSQTQYQHWHWGKSFGGSGDDVVTDMKVKNGYLYITGTYTSPQINWDGSVITNRGGKDIFIAKLDTLGNTIWVKSFGGNADDSSMQLEMNSAGKLVIRCASSGNTISINNVSYNNPGNFFVTLNTNGDIINTVLLPSGPAYNDIDLDNTDGVYVCGQYDHAFAFNGSMIDSSYGLAGAVLLKYVSGNPAWHKNIQVRENTREQILDYSIDPFGPDSIYRYRYTAPVTGAARAGMMIEYNENDSLLNILGTTVCIAFLDGNVVSYDQNQFPRSTIYGYKISTNGILRTAHFHNPWGSFSGNWTEGFATGRSGYTFTTSRYLSLGGYQDYTLTTEKDDRQSNVLTRGYDQSYYQTRIPPTAWWPFQTDESGDYLLCTTYSPGIDRSNVIVLDTNLREIKRAVVAELDRISLSIRAMSDTHAIFFGSSFNGTALTLNQGLPGNSFSVTNNGSNDIVIGKYICDGFSLPQLNYPYRTSYKTCRATDSVQLYLRIEDSTGTRPFTFHWNASSHFSDTTILNPKIYYGGDSITNRLTITDANGMKFYRDFVFFGGREADLRLVVNNTTVCSNDSIVLSLEGTNFTPCSVSGLPWNYLSPVSNKFTSIDTKIKYTNDVSHTVYLTQSDYENPSAFCITPAPVTITVKQAFVQKNTVYVCPGSSYTFSDNITVNNIQNSFSHTAHYVSRINGCDSNYVTNVVVSRPTSSTITRHVCYNSSFYFPNQTVLNNITHDTLYACHYTNAYSCDSVVYYNLISLPPKIKHLNDSVCRGSRYRYQVFNSTYTTGIILSDTTVEIHLLSGNCDSVTYYHLRAITQFNSAQQFNQCSGQSHTFPDGTVMNNISSNTTHVSRLRSISGCDSMVTTIVNIYPAYTITQDVTLCMGGTYTYPDGTTASNLNSSIQHTSTLHTVNGCDSIITTNITITAPSSQTRFVTLCRGSNYTYPDGTTASNITTNTQHTSTLHTVNGCDSIINTIITVALPSYQTLPVTLCQGSNYTYPDGTTASNITTNTQHTSTLHTAIGCDSIINTIITVALPSNQTQSVTACRGSSYTYPDGTTASNISTNTQHTSTLHTVNGCDSIINTMITVALPATQTQSVTVCRGSNYTYPDGTTASNITTNTQHTSALHTVNGCDSIVVTTINISQPTQQTDNVSICKGSNYIFPDGTGATNILTDTQQTSALHTINGCDSIIITNITIKSVDTSVTKNRFVLAANISQAAYQWMDCLSRTPISGATEQSYTASSAGSYAVQIANDGCTDISSCYTIHEDELTGGRTLVQVYPVPARDYFTATVVVEQPATVNLQLLDFTGAPVQQRKVALHAGENRITQNITVLPQGSYLLVIKHSKTNEVVSKRVIKM